MNNNKNVVLINYNCILVFNTTQALIKIKINFFMQCVKNKIILSFSVTYEQKRIMNEVYNLSKGLDQIKQ